MPNSPYKLYFSDEAIRDLQEKSLYILNISGNLQIAVQWENRLRQKIRNTIPVFPHKFPVYGEYNNVTVRFWPYRNDVVFYICDDTARTVTIIAIATAGQEFQTLLRNRSDPPAP